jgi:hypothetical protein
MLGRRQALLRTEENKNGGVIRGGVRQVTVANAMRLLLGLWVMDAPFIYAPLGVSPVTVWNDLIVGGCVVMLATMRLVFVGEARAFRFAHVMLGIWIAFCPWLFGYTDNALYFWNSLISGSLIAALAIWSLVRYRTM